MSGSKGNPETPQFSDDTLDEKVLKSLNDIVARQALRVLTWVIVTMAGGAISFAIAVIFAHGLYQDVQTLLRHTEIQDRQTTERIVNWTQWRVEVDAKLQRLGGDRWSRTNEREFDAQMGYLNPTLKVPDPDIFAERQNKSP